MTNNSITKKQAIKLIQRARLAGWSHKSESVKCGGRVIFTGVSLSIDNRILEHAHISIVFRRTTRGRWAVRVSSSYGSNKVHRGGWHANHLVNTFTYDWAFDAPTRATVQRYGAEHLTEELVVR